MIQMTMALRDAAAFARGRAWLVDVACLHVAQGTAASEAGAGVRRSREGSPPEDSRP